MEKIGIGVGIIIKNKENKILRSIWLVCFIGTVVFSFVCQWR